MQGMLEMKIVGTLGCITESRTRGAMRVHTKREIQLKIQDHTSIYANCHVNPRNPSLIVQYNK